MPQALPKHTKLHNFIMLGQQEGIARCRKGKGMTYLKKRNAESLLQKMSVQTWIYCPSSLSLKLLNKCLNRALVKDQCSP